MKKASSAIVGLVLLAVSVLIFLSLFSFDVKDIPAISFPFNKIPHNLIGITGAYLAFFLLLALDRKSVV